MTVETAMLKGRHATEQVVPECKHFAPFGGKSESVIPSVDGVLKFQRKHRFVSLDDKVRKHGTEEGCSLLAGYDPDELVPVSRTLSAVMVAVDGASELGHQFVDDGLVCHADESEHVVPDVNASWFEPSVDPDATFAIEQSSHVPNVKHESSTSYRWDGGEVGGSPMPGQEWRGRVIPNQAGRDVLPGVRNEHEPPAKAKMCSELHRNVETLAEMTSAVGEYIQRVTDCNFKYLRLNLMAGADFITTDFIEPDNQAAKTAKILWMGNLVITNRRRCGVLFSITAPA